MHAEVFSKGAHRFIGGASAGETDHAGLSIVEMDILDNGVGFDEGEASNRDVFTQPVDQLGDAILDAAASGHGSLQESGAVGGLGGSDYRDQVLDELLEIFIVGDRLGFAADADQGSKLAVVGYVASDQALLGFSSGQLGFRLGSGFSELVNGQ